jgi:hypothetical protein
MLATAAAVGAPGVLLLPLQREFGWSTAAISSALALRLLLFGLMGPFADFTYSGLSAFALFYGLDWIATVPPTVNITVKVFGLDKSNLVFGWVFAGHQLGAAADRGAPGAVARQRIKPQTSAAHERPKTELR